MEGEVIIPSYTFIATAHALSWQGITPVFADIDPSTHNLDPSSVRRMITPRTSGIIGVHLWGRPAPVDALQTIADEHRLSLMFDAAHAFAGTAGARRIGGFGRCEVLSFHATKVFNTFEGGAVLTNDDALAETMRLMRNFGFAGFDNVIHPGTNGKMPEINAAMGLVNLDSLGAFVASNKARYDDYARALGAIDGVRMLGYDPDDTPNYQYVVLEVDPSFPADRDRIVDALQAENILARRYFWPGCHRMKPYRELYPHAGLLLPGTEQVADRVVVLPTGASLVPGCVETVAVVLSALAG
jgi:dTDP-4-amino-4,6-dideoxygalactose transaminase